MITAANTPELVCAVIVEDAPLSIDGARRAVEPTRFNLELMRALAGSILPLAEIQARAGDLLVDAERSIRMKDVASATDLEMNARSLQRHDPAMLDAVIEFEDMHAGYDDSLLARIRCSVLILQADPDRGGAITDSGLQHAIKIVHDGRPVTFPGRGHSMHMEDPQAAIDAVEKFLDQVTGWGPTDRGPPLDLGIKVRPLDPRRDLQSGSDPERSLERCLGCHRRSREVPLDRFVHSLGDRYSLRTSVCSESHLLSGGQRDLRGGHAASIARRSVTVGSQR